jgi:ribosomal-protein-alanine N-acetyltransferase
LKAVASPYDDKSPLAISELCISHLDDVAALERRCLPNPWSKELLQAEFGKPYSRRLGVFSQRKLVAHQLSHLLAEELHILTLCVDPHFRKTGLGTLLLAQTMEIASREGAKIAWLEVRIGNTAALGLYEKSGFARHSVRKGYYSDNGEDAVVLRRALEISSYHGPVAKLPH